MENNCKDFPSKKRGRDLQHGDKLTINGVQITVGSIATSDGMTYILGEPVPIDEAKKIGYGQKED